MQTMEFRYEEKGREVIENGASRERILQMLRQLDDHKRSYCGLSVSDHLYIQCAGSYESLIVEIRVPHPDGFRHYAIGHEPERSDWSEEEQEANERFDAEEAATLFFAFLDTCDVPPSFAKRDMSDMFA